MHMSWKDVVEIPPWGDVEDWRQVNDAVRYLIGRHKANLGPVMETARYIETLLKSFFPLQDQLVQETCVGCQCPCCETATVWYDFCDILFNHLTGQELTERQLIGKQGDICGCFSHRGCVMPRLSRPWVCTLYFCPQQMHRIRVRGQEVKNASDQLIHDIRVARKKLETSFIQITS